MSTAIAHDISIALPGAGPRVATGPRRGHLRLVGLPGERAAQGTSGEQVQDADAAAAGLRPRRARRQGALRLTRRGRLALTSTAALVIALVAASMITVLGPAGATASVVVEPGETLTELASEHLPELPLSQAVTDIQRANGLSTTSIAAGQELVIPGR